MGIKEAITNLFSSAPEPLNHAQVLDSIRNEHPAYKTWPDDVLAAGLADKDPGQFGFLKDYKADAPVPPEFTPKQFRTPDFYGKNPDLARADAAQELSAFKTQMPEYRDWPDDKLASALAEKFPETFGHLPQMLVPKTTEPDVPKTTESARDEVWNKAFAEANQFLTQKKDEGKIPEYDLRRALNQGMSPVIEKIKSDTLNYWAPEQPIIDRATETGQVPTGAIAKRALIKTAIDQVPSTVEGMVEAYLIGKGVSGATKLLNEFPVLGAKILPSLTETLPWLNKPLSEFFKSGGEKAAAGSQAQAVTPNLSKVSAEAGGDLKTSERSAPPLTQDLVPKSQVSVQTLEPSDMARTNAPSTSPGLSNTLGSMDQTSKRIITQNHEDINALIQAAPEAKSQFEGILKNVSRETPGVEVGNVRIKGMERLQQKIAGGKPANTISDYVGGRITVNSYEDIPKVIDNLSKYGKVFAADDFIHNPRIGYRATHLQLELPNGMSAELQITVPEIAAAQGNAHLAYEILRQPDISEPVAIKARDLSQSIFDEAWQKHVDRIRATASESQVSMQNLFPEPASAETGAVTLGPDLAPTAPTQAEAIKADVYDRMEPIKYKLGKEIAPEVPGAGGKYTGSYVEARTLKGKIRAKGSELLQEVNDIIKPLQNFDDRQALNKIYSLRNFAELDRLGKTTSGVTEARANTELAALEQSLGRERFQRISEVADKIAEIQNNKALDILVEGKVITPESAAALRERYPHYLRSEILDEELGQSNPMFKSADNGEPIGRINRGFLKTKEGTKQAINTDVLDVVRRSLVTKVAAAEKQKVVDQVVSEFGREIGSQSWNGSRMITEVDAKKIPLGYVRSTVKASNGKVYALRADVERMMQGLDKQELDIVTKSISSYNRFFKAGATTYRAPFVFSNLVRDAQELFFKGRSVPGQSNRVIAYGKALVSAVKDAMGVSDATFEAWSRGGGAYGGVVTSIPEAVRLPTRVLDPKQKMNRVAGDLAMIPFKAIEIPAQILENTSRLAEYIRLKPTRIPESLKILNSRDITVDFEKMGNSMRVFNNVIPFLNPGVQGTINIARAFRDQPVVSTAKLASYIAVPTLALYAWNRQNERFRKMDDTIDPYLKDNFWVINTGTEIDQNGKKVPLLLTIRKGETAQLFSQFIQGFLEHASQDPNFQQRLKDWEPSQITASMASAVLPPMLKEPVEQVANYDLFRRGPIVSDRIKDVAPGFQFTSGTTNTARRLGEKTNISPARAEHALMGIWPASKQALEVMDTVFQPKPEFPRKEKGGLEKSRSFQPFVRAPSGYFTQAEAGARDFQAQEKQKQRTPAFLFRESLQRYYDQPSAEALAQVRKYQTQISFRSAKDIADRVRKDVLAQKQEPEQRALMRLDKTTRRKFLSQK